MRPLRVLFCSPAPEKLLHQRPAFRFQNARADLYPVVQEICVADAKPACYCACPFIRCTVDQTSHSRLYHRSGAHRARFDRRVNIRVCQPVIAKLAGGFAESNDFSVGCGIAVGSRAIPGNSDEFVFADYTSADGHFAACLRLASGGQCLPHPVNVKIGFSGSHHQQFLSFKQPNGHYRARVETVSRSGIANCQLPIANFNCRFSARRMVQKSAIGNWKSAMNLIGNRQLLSHMLLSISGSSALQSGRRTPSIRSQCPPKQVNEEAVQ